MKEQLSTLGQAFVEHHRRLNRGLQEIVESLQRNEVAEAVARAEVLDQIAGPHIEFEEEVLYPLVAKNVDSNFAARLYGEHRVGKNALATLLKKRKNLGPDERTRLVEDFRLALDHVTSCGSLLSQLTNLEPEEQQHFLERMREIADVGHRWTQLPDHHP